MYKRKFLGYMDGFSNILQVKCIETPNILKLSKNCPDSRKRSLFHASKKLHNPFFNLQSKLGRLPYQLALSLFILALPRLQLLSFCFTFIEIPLLHFAVCLLPPSKRRTNFPFSHSFSDSSINVFSPSSFKPRRFPLESPLN